MVLFFNLMGKTKYEYVDWQIYFWINFQQNCFDFGLVYDIQLYNQVI